MPFCQTQQERGFFMRGWQSGYQDYSCQGEYPYVWSYTYTWKAHMGWPTSIGTIFQESPQTIEIEFTKVPEQQPTVERVGPAGKLAVPA